MVQFRIPCSMQKRRGEAWSILVGERGQVILHRKNELEAYLVVFVPSAGVSKDCEAVKTVSPLIQMKKTYAKYAFLMEDPSSPLST